MVSGETAILEEASDEHLAWMLQAMEMVCAHIYIAVFTYSFAGGRSPCG